MYLDNKLLYQRHSSEEEYVHLPISVGPGLQRVEIRCYCQEEKFSFDYLLSSKVYPQAKGFVGYAYAQSEEGGELILRNDSPMKVFVNGKAVVTTQEEVENRILLEKGDTLLVKSLRTEAAWGFSCDDSLLGRSVVQSDRNYGDRWILLGDFGQEKALEIADGSYVRPYLDSFFLDSGIMR